ncbi:MAG: ATP-binding protein [Nitriliruptorales bacterium]
MRSLRARVAVAAVAATAVAFVLLGVVVVGTFVFDERHNRQQWRSGRPPGPPLESVAGWNQEGPPPQVRLLARRITVVSAGVLALVGVAGLGLGSLALRPLATLRDAAGRVASTRDLATRLPEGDGPEEVDSLANSLNAMLSRLQQSTAETDRALEASRRFAADAGHELRTPLTSIQANLEVLARSPNLSAGERQILADVAREHARIVALLDALQTLARGEAATAVARERLDLTEVIDAAVQRFRARYPRASITFSGPDEVGILGWPEGLRVIVDNLLENALRHGRSDGSVDVSLSVEDSWVRLTVDDDGPGIPLDERERVFERFSRGSTAAPGSGLGLALVAQQAALHGGSTTIGDSPSGGARVTVQLLADPSHEPHTDQRSSRG